MALLSMEKSLKTWRNYEELARHVLLRFADILEITEVEAKQRLDGESGTQWEIDAKGVLADGSGFLVIECKERASARLGQHTVGELVTVIQEVDAQGGVIVTSVGLQSGAKLLAAHHAFHEVFLPRESTFDSFLAKCGNRVLIKVLSDKASTSVGLAGGNYEQVVFPKDDKPSAN